MFFIISPLFLLFFGYPPPPPTFKIDLCTTNLSNKFLSQENLWLWTFYNRQFANVNKKIWCMCNDSNKSLPLSCQLFVYTKITQLITQIFCLLWNLHCQKNLRKEYESKKIIHCMKTYSHLLRRENTFRLSYNHIILPETTYATM